MRNLCDITAAILVGGKGTRLQSVIPDMPKCAAEINGRPMLTYLLDQLVLSGVSKVVLCTGYKAEQLKEVIGLSYGTLKLYYSSEDSPLGTAGAISQARLWFDSDPVLVMNGDSYCSVNLKDYFQWFIAMKASAGLLLTQVQDAGRYGSVQIDDQGCIVHFAEKSTNAAPDLINAGIYLLSQEVITSIPVGRFCSLENEIFPQWIGKNFYGYAVDAHFLDIGTPESYAQASQFFSGMPTIVS